MSSDGPSGGDGSMGVLGQTDVGTAKGSGDTGNSVAGNVGSDGVGGTDYNSYDVTVGDIVTTGLGLVALFSTGGVSAAVGGTTAFGSMGRYAAGKATDEMFDDPTLTTLSIPGYGATKSAISSLTQNNNEDEDESTTSSLAQNTIGYDKVGGNVSQAPAPTVGFDMGGGTEVMAQPAKRTASIPKTTVAQNTSSNNVSLNIPTRQQIRSARRNTTRYV